ncbi:polysaccharide deacetylase [Alteromonadaceae bacterium M269]|nr:polysaccharide deacetylase [Alteromonadaceae bacterium M269]
MRLLSVVVLLCIIFISSDALAGQQCGDKRVVFSFDDAPRGGSILMSGAERTKRIIEALKEGSVKGAAFYSVASHINEANRQRMLDYAEAGHVIANHSLSHANLHNVGAERFIEDVSLADEKLKQLPGFQPLFRFPYLNEGKSIEERDAVRNALSIKGYRQGYVTIDNFDFYIDNFYRRAVRDKKPVDIKAVEALYVDMILSAAEHYDGVACRWMKRSPAHVLLLHENDVAALFLPALIDAFKDNSWSIITTSEAYKDPIAKVSPATLFLGQGRVAALAKIAGAKDNELRHKGEDTDALDKLFEQVLKSP